MPGPALNRLFIFFKVFYSYLVQTTVWCLIYASGNHAWMLKYTNTTAVLCSIKALHWYNCTGWLGIKHQVTYFSINAPSLSGEWLKALFPFRHQTFHADLKIFTPPPPTCFLHLLLGTYPPLLLHLLPYHDDLPFFERQFIVIVCFAVVQGSTASPLLLLHIKKKPAWGGDEW